MWVQEIAVSVHIRQVQWVKIKKKKKIKFCVKRSMRRYTSSYLFNLFLPEQWQAREDLEHKAMKGGECCCLLSPTSAVWYKERSTWLWRAFSEHRRAICYSIANWKILGTFGNMIRYANFIVRMNRNNNIQNQSCYDFGSKPERKVTSYCVKIPHTYVGRNRPEISNKAVVYIASWQMYWPEVWRRGQWLQR